MAPTYLVVRDGGPYQLWSVDPSRPGLVERCPITPTTSIPPEHQLTAIGGYLLDVAPPTPDAHGNIELAYALRSFQPGSTDPLAGIVQSGTWSIEKFWHYYVYRNCDGTPVGPPQLLGAGTHLLSYLPTEGRGSYALWNFDACAQHPNSGADVLPHTMNDPDAFPGLHAGHVLVPLGNCVLAWERASGALTLYAFDPQAPNPLVSPPRWIGTLPGLQADHQLLALGEGLLHRVPASGAYVFYRFDPLAREPFIELQRGTLPFAPSASLTAFHGRVPVDPERATRPGTMDFMRSTIRHVVVLVLESRSFDSVLGWLYDGNPEGVNWIDASPPFRGASEAYGNPCGERFVPQYLYHDGKVSTDWNLNVPTFDPFHGTADSIQQQWSGGYAAYQAGEPADMNGFVYNNGTAEILVTYGPQQLSVLNGLAANFAVSDMWFCSAAGGTTTNRAFLASGSSYGMTTSYEGGEAYVTFSARPRRPSMFKLLANHGELDWALYASILWGPEGHAAPFTYHLFVEGQIPSIDADNAAWVRTIDRFYQDAQAGTLPAFSFLEPVWYQPDGDFTSYHPTGDLIPGEAALKKIYDALKNSPCWKETLFVISFSKGGGLYDHVPTPLLTRPWPHDERDGYRFDATGTRVPTIVVSPWITPRTVFRSGSSTPFDHTSLIATVLDWFGIPRADWWLGDRVPRAPTFEAVLQCSAPRTDAPEVQVAFDHDHPPHDPASPAGEGA